MVEKAVQLADKRKGKAIQWFHVLKILIEDGTWAGLSLSAKALYPVIKSQVSFGTGESVQPYNELMALSGLSKPSVRNGLLDLERAGLLRSEKVGKYRRYFLKERFPVSEDHQAVWQYTPRNFLEACKEVKVRQESGRAPDGGFKVIQLIENLHQHLHIHIHAPAGESEVMVDSKDNDEVIEMMNSGISFAEIVSKLAKKLAATS